MKQVFFQDPVGYWLEVNNVAEAQEYRPAEICIFDGLGIEELLIIDQSCYILLSTT